MWLNQMLQHCAFHSEVHWRNQTKPKKLTTLENTQITIKRCPCVLKMTNERMDPSLTSDEMLWCNALCNESHNFILKDEWQWREAIFWAPGLPNLCCPLLKCRWTHTLKLGEESDWSFGCKSSPWWKPMFLRNQTKQKNDNFSEHPKNDRKMSKFWFSVF